MWHSPCFEAHGRLFLRPGRTLATPRLAEPPRSACSPLKCGGFLVTSLRLPLGLGFSWDFAGFLWVSVGVPCVSDVFFVYWVSVFPLRFFGLPVFSFLLQPIQNRGRVGPSPGSIRLGTQVCAKDLRCAFELKGHVEAIRVPLRSSYGCRPKEELDNQRKSCGRMDSLYLFCHTSPYQKKFN